LRRQNTVTLQQNALAFEDLIRGFTPGPTGELPSP